MSRQAKNKVHAPLQDLVMSASFQSLAIVVGTILFFAGFYLWELNQVHTVQGWAAASRGTSHYIACRVSHSEQYSASHGLLLVE